MIQIISKGNTEWLTEAEQYGLYGRFMDNYVCREKQNGWYYVDYSKHGLRMIFLSSFNHREELRYGFPEEEIFWIKRVLKGNTLKL